MSKVTSFRPRRHGTSGHLDMNLIPDGGWGWAVALASGVSILVTFPITQQFGIIFKDRFQELGISNSQITTILNTQQAISAYMGLFNGPIYHYFSFRKVGLVGAFITFLGLFLSIFCDSFILYLITISITYGIGRGLVLSSSTLALNTYFKNKKSKAISYQFTVAGVGPIFLPHLCTFLMEVYDVSGVLLIFSGLSLHNFACAIIYQPVKWHLKKPKIKLDPETSKRNKIRDLRRVTVLGDIKAINMQLAELPEKKVISDDEPAAIWKILSFMEVDLLRNFSFLNLVIGLAVLSFVDNNATELTPFIMSDFNFNEGQTANIMSIRAASDIFMRFLISFYSNEVNHLSNKILLMAATIGTILCRAVIAQCRNFTISMIAYGCIGMFKGAKVVFWNLVIPTYVPLERLPAALGLQLFTLGAFHLACGPIVGFVRDQTNFTLTLHFLNLLAVIVMCSWTWDEFFRKAPNPFLTENDPDQPQTSNANK